jgi:hypothetical protein
MEICESKQSKARSKQRLDKILAPLYVPMKINDYIFHPIEQWIINIFLDYIFCFNFSTLSTVFKIAEIFLYKIVS